MGSAFDTALPIAGGSRSAVAPDPLIGRNWLKAKIALGLGLIPKLGNLDSWCPTLCGDDRIVNASRIKCLDGRDKPAATPHMGREQRELV
jgi:hypothetical protein